MQENQDSPQEHIPSVREEIGELTPAQKRREDAIFGAIGLLLSQIPWIGAGFNELRQYKAQREMERLSILAHELTERMDEVSEQAVNWDFLHSEQYQDSLLKAVEISLRTKDRKRIALVARILKGAVVSVEQEDLSAAEEYFYLISDLTPQELSVALSIYEERNAMSSDEYETTSEAWKAWAERASSMTGLDVVDLRFALGRIVSSGLLDRVMTMEDTDDIVFIEPEWGEVGIYRITPAFQKLMRFVEMENI